MITSCVYRRHLLGSGRWRHSLPIHLKWCVSLAKYSAESRPQVLDDWGLQPGSRLVSHDSSSIPPNTQWIGEWRPRLYLLGLSQHGLVNFKNFWCHTINIKVVSADYAGVLPNVILITDTEEVAPIYLGVSWHSPSPLPPPPIQDCNQSRDYPWEQNDLLKCQFGVGKEGASTNWVKSCNSSRWFLLPPCHRFGWAWVYCRCHRY